MEAISQHFLLRYMTSTLGERKTFDRSYVVDSARGTTDTLHFTQISLDEEAGALYIKLKNGKIAKTLESEDLMLIDLDDEGKVIGIEVLTSNKEILRALQELLGHKVISLKQRAVFSKTTFNTTFSLNSIMTNMK